MVVNDGQIVELLSGAFKKMFPDIAGRIAEPEVQTWLAGTLIGIVEFSGTLPQETRKQRDGRMECHKVYEGEYKQLAALLRNTYPNERELSAQELLLKVYNGISSVYDVLGASQVSNPTANAGSEEGTSNALDSNTIEQTPVQTPVSDVSSEPMNQEVQNDGNGYVEPKHEEVQSDNAVESTRTETVEQRVEERVETVVESKHEDKVEYRQADSPADSAGLDAEPVEQVEDSKVVQPIGDVSNTEVQNTNNQENMEEQKMSQFDELMQMASDAAAQMGGADNVDGAAPVANVTASKEDTQAATMMAINGIEESLPDRKAWAQNNRVESIIIVKQPAAKRVLGTMGKLSYKSKGADATTPEAEIAKKIAAFVKAVYGQPISEEDWKGLPEESRYQQVIKVDRQAAASKKKDEAPKATNLEKAKKVYDVLTAIKNNPTGEFAAYVNDKNVSYNWKGVVISGQPMNRTSLIQVLLDRSIGSVLGDGSSPEDTKAATIFTLGKAANKVSAKQQGIAGAAPKADKKFVVSVRNKGAFTEQENHVVCLCTKPAENSDSRASFPVAIKPDGFDSCAGAFSYVRKDENGEDAYRPKKTADGAAKFKTGVYTMRVSVPVSDVQKDLAEQFKHIEGYEHPTKIAAYWGITMPQDKDLINSDAHLTKMLASFITGEIGGVEGSETLKNLDRVRKAAQAEADAEEAAQLDQ